MEEKLLVEEDGQSNDNAPTVARLTEAAENIEKELCTDKPPCEPYVANEEGGALKLDSDLDTLRAEFPELAARESIAELDNPTRYAALRELGLTPREAYLATAKRAPRTDSRSHLSDSFHGAKASPLSQMTRGELLTARELFSDLNDGQIHELYKRVR